jgi:mannose-6-phosphate isomerase-like protein (cupin superfamily)
MLRGKSWGSTDTVHRDDVVTTERLVINPNSWCSWHYHRVRVNSFVCVEGTLIIEVDHSLTYGQRARGAGYNLIDRTILKPGDFTVVAPGLTHRFVTEGEPVLALEQYWAVTPKDDDIVRRDVGGRKED